MSISATKNLQSKTHPADSTHLRDMEKIDPLDNTMALRPSSRISFNEMRKSVTDADLTRNATLRLSTQTQMLGKYYPSVYERTQPQRLESHEFPGAVLDFSSDDECPPNLTTASSQAPSTTSGPSRHHSLSMEHHTQRYAPPVSYNGISKPVIQSDATENRPSIHEFPVKHVDPDSPRLDPLGSPGPVTPMDLDSVSLPVREPVSYFQSPQDAIHQRRLPAQRPRY